MKSDRRMMIVSGTYLLLGAVLLALGVAEQVDEFWSGMGGGLTAVGLLRMIRYIRIGYSPEYQTRMKTEMSDERNHFLRNKSWAWAGYLYVLIAGVSVIGLKVMGQDIRSQQTAFGLCLMLILYWGSYMVLRRKY